MPIFLLALFAAQQSPGRGPTPGSGPNGQPPATMVVEPVGMMIAACDANGDARVSRAELEACLARSFAAADPAHKGSIGYVDYADWAQKWLGDRNALPSPFTVDTDGDNKITLAELDAHFDSLFTRFDVDRDGVVTRAELLTIKSGAPAAGPAEGGGRRHGRRE